jgi:malate synthase
VLGDRQNQLAVSRDDVIPDAAALLDIAATPGAITEEGLRNDISVAMQYIAAWLTGSGAVAINNLMEDAATSEIARSQIWQWLYHGRVSAEEVKRITDEEQAKLGDGFQAARELLDDLASQQGFVEFLTLPAYAQLA